MPRIVGVLPAAGRGMRASPHSDALPKALFEVGGVPVIQRNVELMRDQLGIRDIWIVVGHRGDLIRALLGDGHALGIRLHWVTNERVDLGLPYSIQLAVREIDAFCCVVLADECYVDSNHHELLLAPFAAALATCGVMEGQPPERVRENYAVELRDGCIVGLEEKPAEPTSGLMGTGTYLLHPDLLARLRAAFAAEKAAAPRDWTSFLDRQCREGGELRPFFLRGGYVNINSYPDLQRAEQLVRAAAAPGKRSAAPSSPERE